MVRALDVIWIYDECITPPGDKMVVCVEPARGFFFRINSRAHYQIPVPLKREPLHRWLDHDSYLETGQPMELDDYIIDEALRKSGVVGRIHVSMVRPIVEGMCRSDMISEADRDAVKAALGYTEPCA